MKEASVVEMKLALTGKEGRKVILAQDSAEF
jgi:hypothetical protein